MRFGLSLLLLTLIIPVAVTAATNELGWTLDSAIKQLDRQGDDFDSAFADFEARWSSDDEASNRELSGRIYMNSQGEIRFSERAPEGKVVLVTRSEIQEYNPTRALLDRYPISKHKDRLAPYARLGFTITGKDLKDDYLVTLLGEDQISSRRVVGFELTPKDDRERQRVARVQIWVDQASWMPVRQIISHITNGETLTINYSGMAKNLKLNPDLFRDKWPKGTQKIRH